MAGEIFISYRRADEAWARQLHAQLRAEGVEAWYDALVGPGQDWRVATAKALQAGKIFVLLFSENAAQSSDIAKELAAAVLEEKLIIPVRLQNIAPTGAFLYELASRNWINAYENTEVRLAELAKGLAQLAQSGGRDESALLIGDSGHDGQSRRAQPKFQRRPLIIAAIMIITVAALLWLNPKPAAVVASSQQAQRSADISVAVLPFRNLSGDSKEDYFSDGITEEITAALTQLKGLRVVGRTSAFALKGTNEDSRIIGQKLRATHLLEGSVRKDGDQLRITVQLVRSDDDSHLWAQNYDREMKDVFAVQEDIARTIGASLQVPLGLKQGETLVSEREIDAENYQNFLRAKAIIRARVNGTTTLEGAISMLEKIVTQRPYYAPAWATLALAYDLAPNYTPIYYTGSVAELRPIVAADLPKAVTSARRAIALDPRNADGYVSLARAQALSSKWLDAEQSFKQALALDPLNPEGLNQYVAFLYTTGRVKESVAIAEQLHEIESLAPSFKANFFNPLMAAGDYAKALAVAPQNGSFASQSHAAMGRYAEAATDLANSTSPLAAITASLFRAAPAPAKQDTPYLANFSFVFSYVGRPERTFEWIEHSLDAGYAAAQFNLLWQPNFAAARKTERFKIIVRKMGLVDYWRARSWPSTCRPAGVEDFACD